MSEPIKVGDVVALKSGSPRMTVTEAQGGITAKCSYFLGDVLVTTPLIAVAALEKEPDDSDENEGVTHG